MPDREPKAEAQSGIGRETARQIFMQGSAVVILDAADDGIIAELAESVKEPVSTRRNGSLFLETNLADHTAIEACCQRAEVHFGRPVSQVVNCTGIDYAEPIHGREVISWEEVLAAGLAH